MPTGQAPTATPVNIVTVDTSLKVYSRLIETNDWTIDTSLVCTGHSPTHGAQIGSATFHILPTSNDPLTPNYTADIQAKLYNAAVKYKCDNSEGYEVPYYVKVTADIAQVETAIFYGYISSATWDSTANRCVCDALSYAGLLDSTGMFGGWFVNTDDTITWHGEYSPVFNPDGVGNKGGSVVSGSEWSLDAIDNSLIINTENDDNRFTVEDVIKHIWGRVTTSMTSFKTYRGEFGGSEVITTYTNPWYYISRIYNRTLGGTQYAGLSGVGDLSTAETPSTPAVPSTPLDNYTYTGKTFWTAMLELVESVEGFTLTELIDTSFNDRKNAPPYIAIVNLKG